MHHIRWINRRETIYIKTISSSTIPLKYGFNLTINYMPKEVMSSPTIHRKNKYLSVPIINITIPKFQSTEPQYNDILENIIYIPNYCRKE